MIRKLANCLVHMQLELIGKVDLNLILSYLMSAVIELKFVLYAEEEREWEHDVALVHICQIVIHKIVIQTFEQLHIL